jgi:UDP:flavonoid glycosyltransferase YjiC (YdhE family)
MARFLFVVPPLTGHVNPTVSVAHELEALGHEVAWVGYPSKVAGLLPAGARLLGLDDDEYGALEAGFAEETQRVRLLESVVFLWERFLVPLVHAMIPGVDQAVEAYEPDLLVVDQQALAGAVVARRRGLPWATTAPSAADALDRTEPGANVIWDFIDGQYAQLQEALGLEGWARPDNSPDLVLVFSTRALFGEVTLPAAYRFVGPAMTQRPSVDFPWEALRDGPKVLVSLGTVNPERGEAFYRQLIEGLGGEPYQVILSAPASLLPDRVPDNFLVRDYLPQLKLLAQMDAVLCHAGQNTVAEALANGLPLVMTPIRDDQPIVANLVARAGAGIRLRFGKRLSAAKLRDAVHQVLSEPGYRAAAAGLRSSFEAAGGARRAAELLVELHRSQAPKTQHNPHPPRAPTGGG